MVCSLVESVEEIVGCAAGAYAAARDYTGATSEDEATPRHRYATAKRRRPRVEYSTHVDSMEPVFVQAVVGGYCTRPTE